MDDNVRTTSIPDPPRVVREEEPAPESPPEWAPDRRIAWLEGRDVGYAAGLADRAAVGVPEPDPQPIGWQVRIGARALYTLAFREAAVKAAEANPGSTIHALMPAGWVPAGTPRKADR